MAPAASVWDHKADKDLLLSIIDEGQLKGVIWPTIAAKMQAKGYTFTKEACRQHFQKIRKESRNSAGGSNEGGASGRGSRPSVSNKTTPRTAKSMTDSFATSNGSFPNNDYGHGYEDDDEEFITPTKRKRTTYSEGLKTDSRENDGRSAVLFKIEGYGDKKTPIDLENDRLYEDDSYT